MKPYSSRSDKKPSRFKKLLRWSAYLGVALAGVALLALAAYTVVFFKPSLSTEQMAAQWAPAPSKFVDVAGVRVHVRDLGPQDDARPIVMIHGTDTGMTAWLRWADVLQKRRRVILLDLPGFGLSDTLPDGGEGSAAYARFMLALLDQLGVRQCSLVGHAFGGEVAWQTAYLAPDRITRLTLIAPDGYPTQPWKVPLDEELASLPVIKWLGLVTRSRWVIERGVEDRFADHNKITPEIVDRYFALPLHEGNRRAQIMRLEHGLFGSPTSRLSALHLPTLIIWGELDRQSPSEQAHWFGRDVAGSQVLVVDNIGHVPQEEDPDRVLNDQVYGFLTK
jgi:pimeloyl-ACP methyl ester carboxylesterase